jgi:hypothetical protein
VKSHRLNWAKKWRASEGSPPRKKLKEAISINLECGGEVVVVLYGDEI